MIEPSKEDLDAIVVGTGPGGATVSRELSQHGRRVLILEWGGNEPVNGTFRQMSQDCFVPGKSLYITKNLLAMVRAITTGGSSLYYCAHAVDPPLEMLKRYGVDITQEVEEIKSIVPCAPLRDDLMPQAGKVFLESALELGYDCRKVNKYIYQDKCREECDLCLVGCPHGAKWTARNFVDDALESGAQIVNRAKVKAVIVENGKAVGVRYEHENGRREAYAPKIVLAAGGIGSPSILRQSGIDGVGYDFFFDPLWFIWGRVDRVTSGRGTPMTARIILPEEGIVLTDHNMPHLMKAIFDIQGFKPWKALSFSNMVPIQVKVRDALSGHIGRRGWVWKGLQQEDWQKLNSGFDHAKRILENAGARGIYKSPLLAAHPGGTVKIGEHVDANLKTAYENLYVCDASVIPDEMGLPPSLTILSLGKRLSKHLLGVDQCSSAGVASTAGLPA